MAITIGVLSGIVAAVRRGRLADYVATGFGLIGLSVPHFWLGLLGILLFSVQLHWLPASGFVPFTEDPARQPAAHGDARPSCSAPGSPPC